MGGQYDPETGEFVRFCDDPARWMQLTQGQVDDWCAENGCAIVVQRICDLRPQLAFCR